MKSILRARSVLMISNTAQDHYLTRSLTRELDRSISEFYAAAQALSPLPATLPPDTASKKRFGIVLRKLDSVE